MMKEVKWMESNEMTADVRVGLTVPDEVAKRCLSVVAMWLEDHPDMTVQIDQDENGVLKDVSFQQIHKWLWCPYCGRKVKWDD